MSVAMIVTKFCNHVLGILCIALSLGAAPVGGYSHPSLPFEKIQIKSKKPNSPTVELLTHECQLDPLTQSKIYRGIQFQYDFYAQHLGYDFSSNLVVRIRIFRDADTYRAFIDANYPHIPKTWIGVYLSGVNEILVSLEKDEDAFYKNIFHETSHLLLTDKVKNCPNWLNEGLAEYFEFMDIEGEEVVIHPQVIKDTRIKNWLSNHRMPDLLSSISMTNKEWNFNDNVSETDEPRTLGWSIAYFMMSNQQGQDCIKGLLSHLAKNARDTQASVQAIDMSYPGGSKKLVQDWKEWIPKEHLNHEYLVSPEENQTQTALINE
ncbi:DUF1570 domain-containing protein [Cytophagaceae bacterium DM2B3-1]|uniref:DUF1570 domain-containing protein n=1 Tax=Xanthocytophaga flava TaxID=3048013 RepID=A0ABT7CPT1_9BACT|nr:DUF1570 domain-containing protein [Xanthocytophaga flavus]MDJ1471247.1 DUF1570 domain-containing protein [Xanthocytophaga flavus]MDJ1495754.1 DUF1570 domain-containing protein [Xanthocytophaga flavus]